MRDRDPICVRDVRLLIELEVEEGRAVVGGALDTEERPEVAVRARRKWLQLRTDVDVAHVVLGGRSSRAAIPRGRGVVLLRASGEVGGVGVADRIGDRRARQ